MMDEFNRTPVTELDLETTEAEVEARRLAALKNCLCPPEMDPREAELARLEKREALLHRREISRRQSMRASKVRGRSLAPRRNIAMRRT